MFLPDDADQRMVVVIYFDERIVAGSGGEKASDKYNPGIFVRLVIILQLTFEIE